MWDADLTLVEREFTLVGVLPALDEFTELAASMHAGAVAAAHQAGQILAAAGIRPRETEAAAASA
ncbi:MAG TPA: hypothetical protein VGJ19_23040 [Streptosporangiaceae bacterium]